MLPSPQDALLIINKQSGIWGTAYNPANDLVRVPLARTAATTPVERMTMSIRDGRLWIEWDDAVYSVPIRQPGGSNARQNAFCSAPLANGALGRNVVRLLPL